MVLFPQLRMQTIRFQQPKCFRQVRTTEAKSCHLGRLRVTKHLHYRIDEV